ncbi:MAG: Gfo/Idh/MocA family oxidoreductase [Lentisphaerae bacterium]|jgi:predicted dehydrogenase|nr:Gfo/Idh/MocA family oxidoreductase [Lentisphaerota bacterium]
MKKVKFGVLGAGGIARRRTIPGMLQADNIELAAVMDVVNIKEIAAEFKVPKAYDKAEDLLADPDIQAVYIASPVSLHLEQILAAAKAGKHILCEKPLTMSSEDAVQAVAACKKAGVFLQEGYMMKFHGAHQAIRDIIASGKIGKVVYMRGQLSCWYPPIPGAWRQDPAKGGGGSLIDMATHLYDLLEFFVGPIRKLVAFTGNQVQNYKSEDSSTTMLEFDNGAHATVDAFFCVPDEASRTRLEIYGSAGSIFTEGTIGQSQAGVAEGIFGLGAGGYDAKQTKDVVREFQPIEFPAVNPYTAECAYFADCILKGVEPAINNGDNAIRIMRLTEQAYASARDGKVKTI